MLPYYYFLKVIICSAVFVGYYFIVLRNKTYHQYNRFYLLTAMLLSWVIPFVNINLFQLQPTAISVYKPVYTAINFISNSNNSFENETNVINNSSFINIHQIWLMLYASVSLIFIIITAVAIKKIIGYAHKYPKQKNGNITLVLTQEADTPFSFFKIIFWNTHIDLYSKIGKQILQHELTHIQQKHSWDKAFVQLNIIAAWFNPFFWIIKNELEIIHEFIADKNSVQQNDAANFAEILLTAAFPANRIALSNSFFFSPIDRRLTMLTKNTNPKFSYWQKLFALPILAFIVLLFSFKKEKVFAHHLSKKYKVIIDAGHGGKDVGVNTQDGTTTEKEITLAIAQQIQQLSKNNNIEIILTRNDDTYIAPKERADFSNNNKADLFVSLHCNNANDKNEPTKNGTEIYIVSKENDNGYRAVSAALAQQVNATLSQNFVTNHITSRQVGIWVLQATQCPAILIETGYLSNTNDLAILKNEYQLQLIAANILTGVENYLYETEVKLK